MLNYSSELRKLSEGSGSRSTRAMLFLTVIGNTLVVMSAEKYGMSYNQVLKTKYEKIEFVYSDGFHSYIE